MRMPPQRHQNGLSRNTGTGGPARQEESLGITMLAETIGQTTSCRHPSLAERLLDPNMPSGDGYGHVSNLEPCPGAVVTLTDPPATDLDNRWSIEALTAPLFRTWQRLGATHLWAKVFLFSASLFLFVLALTLMKEGARGLAPLVRDGFAVSNAINSLGFGWLFAYVIMSGSPVAAAALTLFDAGVVDQLGAFSMITGSRLGANFVVLLVGFIYVLRGRNRANSLGMGLLSLTVTGSTYLVGLVLGAMILSTGVLDGVQLGSGTVLNSLTDAIFNPIVGLFAGFLPDWTLFLVGLAIIMGSFSLFDRCLPQMTIKESQVGRVSRLVYRPWVMFTLGGLVTLISMSVSVSLSILVPLSNRGFVRRENVIPYIMGANITTFIDTLLAAVLLDNPPAFTVVLVEMLSITVVSIFILLLIYRQYERVALDLVGWMTSSNRNLAIFLAAILVVPIILLVL